MGLRPEIEGAMFSVASGHVPEVRCGRNCRGSQSERCRVSPEVVIGADLSGGEEVTGRSGIQVSNTEGGIVANRVN